MTIDGKETRIVPGIDGYAMAEDGSVYDLHASPPARLRVHGAGRPKSPAVAVRVSGRRAGRYVHVLLMQTWGPPRPGPQYRILHRDLNPWNFSLDNLVWVTPAELKAAQNLGPTSAIRRGENHANAKLTAADVVDIRKAYAARQSPQEIAERFDVSEDTAYRAAYGLTWKHIPETLIVDVTAAFPGSRPIPGPRPGYYATPDGRIVSTHHRLPRVLKPRGRGGRCVCIYQAKGEQCVRRISDLVALAFPESQQAPTAA